MYRIIDLAVTRKRLIVARTRHLGFSINEDDEIFIHETLEYTKRLGNDISIREAIDLMRLRSTHPEQLENETLRRESGLCVLMTLHQTKQLLACHKFHYAIHLPTSGFLSGMFEIYLAHLDKRWKQERFHWGI